MNTPHLRAPRQRYSRRPWRWHRRSGLNSLRNSETCLPESDRPHRVPRLTALRHEALGRRAGLTEEQIRDLANFEDSAVYSECESETFSTLPSNGRSRAG